MIVGVLRARLPSSLEESLQSSEEKKMSQGWLHEWEVADLYKLKYDKKDKHTHNNNTKDNAATPRLKLLLAGM